MSQVKHTHAKSTSHYFQATCIALPFLTKRVHPLDFRLPEVESRKRITKNKVFYTPRSKLQDPHSKPSLLSLEIPPISYSSFKKRQNLKRRHNKTIAPLPDKSLKNPSDLDLKPDKLLIKESVTDKRAFRRIEAIEIEHPAFSFGQKIVRVHELVIEPLKLEGNFYN